ncbi:MAG TPA: peptidoglycan DD-metalloendopeptidase family protein [Candidatus Saccharimonadia bacterium]|nr:peptidoglycan DD-metalloendopeptidase family protein [Candidatus Saccharimonadia bacterium]
MLSLPVAPPLQALQPDESAHAQQLHAQMTAGERGLNGKPHDVKSAAAELASLFVYQMLAAMRRTVPKSSLLDKGFAHDTYLSLFDQEIARHMARREDLGLTALLQRQLKNTDADRQLPGRPDTALPRPSTALHARRALAIDAYRQQAGPTDDMFMLPVEGQHTSGYGMRMHPIDHEERQHGGMDIAAPTGTPIQAAAAGQVVFSGTQAGYGNVVVIQHAEGYSTLYAHNTTNLVSVGTPVSQGQPIATVGSTGRSTGSHLHFEVRKDGKRLDPALFCAAGSTPKPAAAIEASSSPKIALKFLIASADTEAIQ